MTASNMTTHLYNGACSGCRCCCCELDYCCADIQRRLQGACGEVLGFVHAFADMNCQLRFTIQSVVHLTVILQSGLPRSVSSESSEALPAFANMDQGQYPNSPKGHAASCPACLQQDIPPAAVTLPLLIFLLALLISHALHHAMKISIPLPTITNTRIDMARQLPKHCTVLNMVSLRCWRCCSFLITAQLNMSC